MVQAILRRVSADRNSINPRLSLYVELSNTSRDEVEWVLLNGGELRVLGKDGWRFISKVYTSSFIHLFQPGEKRYVMFYADLDPWRLEEMEKARAGGDLYLTLTVYLGSYRQRTPDFQTAAPNLMRTIEGVYARDPRSGVEQVVIPKSEWVEHHLPILGYRKVRLIEVPLIEPAPEEFKEIIIHLDYAWKHFHMGEYNEVLRECRIAIEAMRNWFFNQGWKKEKRLDQERTKYIPDFKVLVGSEKISRYLEDMYEGIYGFTSPAAHYGRVFSKPEAEYILMMTYSLVSYVVKVALR